MKVFLFVVIILGVVSAPAFSQEDKPNIVFFLVDDLGWSDLGCYGSEYYSTPNIDKLAEEGMRFTSAYMMPTCSPSRASLMTGKYPPRTGIYTVDGYAGTPLKLQKVKGIKSEKYLTPDETTIAEVLNRAGYTTGHFGKWHLGNTPETYPKGQGFDVNLAGCEWGSPQSYFSPFERIKNIDVREDGEYLTEVLTDGACSFIDKNRDKPFFLYFPFYQVHVPIHAKKKWVEKYMNRMPFGLQDNPNYGAMISYMDYSVGRVLKKLDEYGLSENTIVILASDNGGQIMVTSNAPLRGQKGNLYEGGIRVPLIVKWPGKVSQESRCGVPVTVVDYFPTLLEMSGTDVPKGKIVDGESIVPLLNGKRKLERDAIFWHLTSYNGNGRSNSMLWQPPGGAIRKGNWKLIENFEDGNVELYNLKNDIGETTDLSDKNKKKTSELLMELKAWQADTDADIPKDSNPSFERTSRNWVNEINTRNPDQAKNLTLIRE